MRRVLNANVCNVNKVSAVRSFLEGHPGKACTLCRFNTYLYVAPGLYHYVLVSVEVPSSFRSAHFIVDSHVLRRDIARVLSNTVQQYGVLYNFTGSGIYGFVGNPGA
jgi:hypothetical protein